MSSDANKRRGQESIFIRQECIVQFPSDRSMGECWIHDKVNQPLEDLWPENGQYSKELGEARGLVILPRDEGLNITVSTDASKDLSSLTVLKLNDLQGIYLNGTGVSDDELVHLKRLTLLRELGLSGTQVSDDGLVYLKGLTSLHTLHLSDTKVSDVGLKYLKELTSLKQIFLYDTRVSETGKAYLASIVPKLEIYLGL